MEQIDSVIRFMIKMHNPYCFDWCVCSVRYVTNRRKPYLFLYVDSAVEDVSKLL